MVSSSRLAKVSIGLIGFSLLLSACSRERGATTGSGSVRDEVMERTRNLTKSSSASSQSSAGMSTSLQSSSSSAMSSSVAMMDLSLTVESDKAEVHPGDTVFFTVTVRNNTAAAVSGFQVIQSFSPLQLAVVDSDGASQTDTVTWTIDSLGAGQQRALRMHATVKQDVQSGDRVRTNAIVLRNNIVEPGTAFAELTVLQALPSTGIGDGTKPLEDTTRFLTPVNPR